MVPLVDDSQMILLYRSNGELPKALSDEYHGCFQQLTISVASTRVPTIFSRTRVFFSMI